jgi:hypothetical protein
MKPDNINCAHAVEEEKIRDLTGCDSADEFRESKQLDAMLEYSHSRLKENVTTLIIYTGKRIPQADMKIPAIRQPDTNAFIM